MNDHFLAKLFERLPIGVIRFVFNCWPPFRGAGIKVNYISPDYLTFDVSMKLGLLNRNYAGVHFGGSLFSMVDPFFMITLAKNLGNQYIVWDKAGSIEFKKPGRGIIKARCAFSAEEIMGIRKQADELGKIVFDRSVDLLNDKNEVIATINKTLYVRRKQENPQGVSA